MSRRGSSRARADATAPRPVIDAQFRVVGAQRRVLGALWRGLIAVLVAALIGFLIPPLWIFIDGLRAGQG